MPLASSSPFVGYVDLYGKRRQAARVQVIEREIGLLQDEIKSLGSIGLASSSCKELDDFIDATPDPLIAINPMSGGSKNFLKIFGRKFSCLSWMCCFCGTCCGSHISCCCDVKKSCSWRLCKCCTISCRCSFDLSCPKYSVCCCNLCPCF
ncbi:unnamed protein product [Lactuca virosa]|uniref:Guanine nucleotide-binding protein subunit gamma 3-like n=1 Tax=Lactuca virosa TaxID=75947 RepID=A0AAU9MLA2_9ASTR|nr:unnamed protein product [Lactuca virosa]